MSDRFALLIGNGAYADARLSHLKAPTVDVTRLGRLLSDATIGGFGEVIQLANPSVAQAQREIARFFNKRKGSDLLLLYFSGHGVLSANGRLYLALADTEHDLLSGTALSANFIRDEMQNSSARSQVLILDCCHSGAIDRTTGKGSESLVIGSSVGTASIFEGTGKLILTATDAVQIALESNSPTGEVEPSVFTKYLIEGLESGLADLNNDGLVSVDELYEYTYNKVVADVSTSQTPMKIGMQGGQLIIAKNPLAPNLHKPQVGERGERAFEILSAAYRDWVTFEKQDHRLLDLNDLNLVFEQTDETTLPAPLLEYVLSSIVKARQVPEIAGNRLRTWFAALGEDRVCALVGQLIQDSDIRVQERIIVLARLSDLRAVTNLLIDLLSLHPPPAISVVRSAIEAIYAFESRLPPSLVSSLLTSTNDWLVHALALRSINEQACLLISDGSKYSQDLGKIMEDISVRVLTLSPIDVYEIEEHGGYDVLRTFSLIAVVRGDHYSSLEGNIFPMLLREYVERGGRLFATCWFSWEIKHGGSAISDVLPFLHGMTSGQDFYEDVVVHCRPTDVELSKVLFSQPMSFRSSFEPLQPKEDSVVLLEQELGIPVLGYHHFHKGVCYYLNTCQHSCTTDMPSPVDSEPNLHEGLKRFFGWILEPDSRVRE